MTDTLTRARAPITPSRRAFLGGLGGIAAFVAAPTMSHAQARSNLERVNALIAQMTIEEKCGQISLYGDPFRFRPENVNPLDGQGDPARISGLIRAGHLGNLFNGVGAAAGRQLQDLAMNTRLKIPLMFAADIIHGMKTIYPIPLGEAAAFDADVAYRTARAAAVEGAAACIHQTYAPMVDVCKDQRWGRVAEGAGEDTHLNSVLAVARVRGFQGERGLTAEDALLATPKHFAAYGAAEGGADYATTDMSEQTLRNVYLPPFKAAFDAGALSTMSAFNALNGVPASGSRFLMTEILRDEWRFAGYVVSDYTADQELIAHGYARDARDAARIALIAGVDMSMVSGYYAEHVPGLVAAGEVPMAVVDEAVRRVLMTKAALGLFENPYKGCDPAVEARVVGQQSHFDLAREAGRKSIVMLKNDGNLLPLPKSGKKIALIGPCGDDKDLLGTWVIWGDREKVVSNAEGFREAMENADDLIVARGCEVEAEIDGGVEEAVRAAREADIIVLSIGESASMSGEAQSRTEIVIPEPQMKLARAIAELGKPTVVLLRNGRGLELSGPVKDADAILVTWFLGNEMGRSVADIVFGDHSPSGRLPVSFPVRSGQSPYAYDHLPSGRPSNPTAVTEEYRNRWRETPMIALYPFGHGLTYGQVAYSGTTAPANMPWDAEIQVACNITNGGNRPVVETAQLYIRDRVATLSRPVRELKDFRKVELAAGETKTVTFTLKRSQLEFVGVDLTPTVEPGEFDVWIAASAQVGEPARFTLTR